MTIQRYTFFKKQSRLGDLRPMKQRPREKMNSTSVRGERGRTSPIRESAMSWRGNMKAGPILQLVLLVMLLAEPSEEFFLEYSKKALQEFFQSLKAKKQPPNIQHYHYYYPIPYSMLMWPKVPVKRDLEKLYDDTFAFGSDHHYKYLSPSIIMSNLQQLFDAEIPTLDDMEATIDRNGQGLLVQVPLNQQFVFHLLRRLQQRQMAKATT